MSFEDAPELTTRVRRGVCRDGSGEPRPLDLALSEARLRGDGVRLPLGYVF